MKSIIIIALILSLALVSATDYYVEVHDGIGAGSGDNNNHTTLPDPDPEPDPEDDEPHKKRVIVEKIEIIDSRMRSNSGIGIGDSIIVDNLSNTTDTADKPSEPVDWAPIIIWSLIIIGLLVLVFGGYWIYQIYFY